MSGSQLPSFTVIARHVSQHSHHQTSFNRKFSTMGNKDRARAFVDEKIASDKVVVFSKSYCPFCTMAKKALNETGVKFTLIEIEDMDDCDAIQDYLKSISKIRSVPQVFIGGKFAADGSKTKAMKQSGELEKVLKDCGAL